MDDVLQQAVENYKRTFTDYYQDPIISVGDIISLNSYLYLHEIAVSVGILDSGIQDIFIGDVVFCEDDLIVDYIGINTRSDSQARFSKIMILKNKDYYYCHVILDLLYKDNFSNYWKIVHKDMALEYEMFF